MAEFRPLIKRFRLTLTRILSLLLIVLVIFSGSRWEEKSHVVASVLFFAGCFLVGIGTLGRLWCNLYIVGYRTKALVTEGPYSMCRNPLYFFSLIGALGIGLVTEMFSIALTILIFYLLYYPNVIRSEEAVLSDVHGNTYEMYRSSTPCLLPRLSLFREPRQYVVVPRTFRKKMFGLLWFIWLVGIMELIEHIHEGGTIPVLIKLY